MGETEFKSAEPEDARTLGRARKLALWVSIASGLLAAVLVTANHNRYFYYGSEQSDEVALIYQARLFEAGELYHPPHPAQEFLGRFFVNRRGREFGKFPPFHSFLLASGFFLFDSIHFVPGLTAGLTVLLLTLITFHVFGSLAGVLSAVFGATSPLIGVAGATWLSHGTELLMLTLSVAAFFLAARRPRLRWFALAAAVLFAAAFLTRYMTAPLVLLAAALAWLLPDNKHFTGWSLDPLGPAGETRRIRTVVGLTVLCGAAMVLAFLVHNFATVDSPYPPRLVIHGWDRPAMLRVTGLDLSLRYLTMLSDWASLLPVPLLILVPVALVIRCSRATIFAGLFLALQVLAYNGYNHEFFRPWNSSMLGPRYYYPLLLLQIPLQGAALAWLVRAVLRRRDWHVTVLALGVIALVALLLGSTDAASHALRRARRTWEWRRESAQTIAERCKERSLVFLQGDAIGVPYGHLLNDPWLSQHVIYALDHGVEEDIEFHRRYFPGRQAYLLARNDVLTGLDPDDDFLRSWIFLRGLPDEPEEAARRAEVVLREARSAADVVPAATAAGLTAGTLAFEGNFVRMDRLPPKPEDSRVALVAAFETSGPTVVPSSISCRGKAWVFLDGEHVLTRFSSLPPVQDEFPFDLRVSGPGHHLLLVVFEERGGDSGFYFRFKRQRASGGVVVRNLFPGKTE